MSNESEIPPRLDELSPAKPCPELEQIVQGYCSRRVKWLVALLGVPSLLALAGSVILLIEVRRERAALAKDIAQLKQEAVRYGQPVEIHNPKWGTVVDGVDPSRFPGRDPRDPRRGATLQQYVPLGNEAQAWELRPLRSVPAAAAQPAPAKAYTAQGFVLLRNRDFANAIAAFENCLQLYPDFSEAHDGLARCYRDMGDLAKAVSSHDRAIALEPDRHDFYWERGVTYLRMNNPDGAITNFQACLDRNPDFGSAHTGLGMAYRSKGNYKEALAHHDKAIELFPGREDFWRERGITYQRMGDSQRAEADMAKAREVQQNRR
jgi:tetratricopeptide (TPR) repeat protein